ncbi:MAG: hypothetical protein AAB197_03760, partial [Deltaproteobacteria bacterium]
MTVEQAAKRLKSLSDFGAKCNINLLECVQTIICRASRPERRLGKPFMHKITSSLVTSGTIPAIIYSAKAQVSFPAVWQAMLAKDAGFSSYEAYTMNRKFSGIPHECAPPMAWVKAYINYVNTQAWTHWDIKPDPANSSAVHSAKALANHPSLDKGERMTLDKIVYIDLFAAVKSHILHAASLGHDVTPFLRTEENLPGSPNYSPLIYKLAFDTTETATRPMLMIGLIPHVFARRKVQSADNVTVLCLAKLNEDYAVLQDAIPNLGEKVKKLTRDGITIQSGESHMIFNVEMHIAADLKAL